MAGDFTRAGEASSKVKNKLKQLGVNPDIIRRVAIAMYEGEINMVIHSEGGEITTTISPEKIEMILEEEDRESGYWKAMQEGFSTASENARNRGLAQVWASEHDKPHNEMYIISN
jgi:anti-sigma regulatory factor (Ser/Thr protein kinase)